MEKALESNAVKASQRQRKDKTYELRALILGSKARSVEVGNHYQILVSMFLCKFLIEESFVI